MSFATMAARLGCSTQHLHLVVREKRTSHRLLARYHALILESAQ